jgi:pseudouridine synthase
MEERLQKYFTTCGVLSRRAAEKEIEAGHVSVNGEIATLGTKIDPTRDEVCWNGKPLRRKSTEKHYFLLNKPRGFVTTLKDEKGRRTVTDLMRKAGVRLYPVGRLDMDSDGLLLMTDDGALTYRLTHPRHEIPKLYHVTVKGTPTKEVLARLGEPFLLDGYKTAPVKVAVVSRQERASVLSFELHEGRNRQIRRMCEEVGLSITRLTRMAIGKITLGNLKEGTYRPLTNEEIQYLKGTK